MASGGNMTAGDLDFGRRRRHRRVPEWAVFAIIGAIAAGIAFFIGTQAPTVSDRPGEQKTVRVVLPPPPPPPPPPEVKPDETPPEPKPAPVEQAQDTPPPQTPQSEPVQGDSALTAREGPGPSNYGLQAGDGSGTTIGGKPGGGNGFGAYAESVRGEIYRATDRDPALQGRFSALVQVWVDADGRVQRVRILSGSGDSRRDAALERRLVGLQFSQRPPEGLPSMRIQLARTGA